jgi:cyclopropane fatty-acyl-phospholipid synthase-like methyltransferase
LNAPNHESTTWTSYLEAGSRTHAVDPDTFRETMRHDRFPRASAYDPVWAHLNHMGPSVLWLTESLAQQLPLEPGMRVLNLGCGSAISSIFLARE